MTSEEYRNKIDQLRIVLGMFKAITKALDDLTYAVSAHGYAIVYDEQRNIIDIVKAEDAWKGTES